MEFHPWRIEGLRLLGIATLIPIIYLLSDSLWLSVSVVTFLYIVFLWWKIFLIHRWLNESMPEENTPNSIGVLGDLITLIYRHKIASEYANQEQAALTQQFHETMAAIPSATIILNKDDEIEWANYSALRLLGINGQRDVGIRVDTLLRQPDFIGFLHSGNHDQLEMPSPVSSDQTLGVQIVKYAERRRLLLAHNITPHLEVQRSRRMFIANASHELRTPLTVVSGYLEFMQSDPDLPNTLSRPIEKAIEQSSNMEILINDLLVLSKLEDKELDAEEITLVNLKKHLYTTLQTLEASGKTHDHTIRADIEDKNLSIQASIKELNSVCFNLINNAIKYSDPNSEIHIKWEKRTKKQVRFSVTDQGIGIAPKHITHLTERFYRVDSGRSRRVGGTGLGLSIVKHILERHNGHLEVESTLGEGSTFSAIFPVTISAE